MKHTHYNFFSSTKKLTFLYCMLLMLSLVLISSCNKNVLDKTPLDRFSDDLVWKDKNLITAFVNNTYRVLPTGNTYGTQRLGSAGTDEIHARGGGSTYINQGNITAANSGNNNFWGSFYPVITKCNIYFDNIATSPVDAATKDKLSGTMKLLRAFSYFKLAAFYGGVPLITKPFILDDKFDIPKNTYAECMDFVIKELDEAIALLPATLPAAALGGFTKATALAVKSRALLYMASPLNNLTNSTAKWQAAADAAKAVIDYTPKFSLFNNYKTLFLRANSYNSEVIWSRPYNYDASAEASYLELSQYPNGYNGFGQSHPYHDMVQSYEILSGKLPADDPAYDPQNPYVDRDPRFYMSIIYDGLLFKGREVETFIPKGQDSREGALSAWNSTETGYYLRKFIDETVTNPGTLVQGNSPFIFFRLAEIYLNYAEAKYFLGDEATCKQYINLLRSRPGVNMPLVTESGAALLARLQNERKIELAFEEHRWFDIRRWKIAPAVMSTDATIIDIVKNLSTGKKTYTVKTMYKRGFNDRNYLVPIPLTEIQKNANLVQNPGY